MRSPQSNWSAVRSILRLLGSVRVWLVGAIVCSLAMTATTLTFSLSLRRLTDIALSGSATGFGAAAAMVVAAVLAMIPLSYTRSYWRGTSVNAPWPASGSARLSSSAACQPPTSRVGIPGIWCR
ncbi:MAG: hypothetical protein AB1331_06965 [Bacillota bacterium]